MLSVYTYWSRHYNEVIIIVAKSSDEAYIILKEVYLIGCDVDDWIIGGSIPCKENQSISQSII